MNWGQRGRRQPPGRITGHTVAVVTPAIKDGLNRVEIDDPEAAVTGATGHPGYERAAHATPPRIPRVTSVTYVARSPVRCSEDERGRRECP